MKKKILVVDDDASIREILATQLGRLNYDTMTAADGKEAVAMFKTDKPDLVLMDVMMPQMDGLTACQKIRAGEKKGSRVPILFLTARGSRQDQLTSALSGGDDFISKPISLQELREHVEKALERSKNRQPCRLALACCWLAPPRRRRARHQPLHPCLLLLGEGGDRDWKEAVAAITKELGKDLPLEFAAGSADEKAIQKSVDRLQAQRVKKLVVVPLFESSASDVMEEIRYLLGIRKDPSEGFFANSRRGAQIVRRIQTRLPVVLTPALDDQPVVVEILTSRALALSRKAEGESLVILGQAPRSEAAAEQLAQTLNSLAERVRAKGGFVAGHAALLEDDLGQSRRDKAAAKAKTLIQGLGRKTRVVVVAYNMTSSGAEKKVSRALSGVFMKFSGKGLLPDARLTKWVSESPDAGSRLPDIRVYKDAGRAPNSSQTKEFKPKAFP